MPPDEHRIVVSKSHVILLRLIKFQLQIANEESMKYNTTYKGFD